MRPAFIGILACAVLWCSAAPRAAPFPSRPVTVIVPYGAGGPLDTLARILAERMRVSLGQPVLIENVTGASGSIGVGRAARAEPDGYTLSIGNWATHVVNGAAFNLPYDLLHDLAPVALLSSNPYLAVARTGLPARNLKELIATLKASPGTVTLGTGGPGSGQHISGVYFENATGTMLRFVPYRAGSSDILKDLAGGHIDLTFDQAISALPYVRNGQIRAYAVTTATRLAAAPDIPTVDEAGAPGVYISAWSGLWVPGATPPNVIATLTAAAMDALASEEVRRRLEDLGQAVPPPAQQTAEALAAFHRAEIEKWWPIIKAAGP
ncbi:MAG: tripartite tricarboxylate transporter substrate-binding protein [Alphaproteobacteria bacterium]|nr:tripartite tricarboxylate transporter substrate-binding protein [Alphaproteobacteria bacterium]